MSSRIGYPGFVLATGLGALILLDLSLAGHAGNRYLALYHQGHLWLAMLALSLLLFARRSLSRGFAWLLSVGGEATRRAPAAATARVGVAVVLVLATAAAVLAFGLALANLRQLTSELGRVWLIVGAAWFFFLRAGPLTERLARGGTRGDLVPALRLADAVRRRRPGRRDVRHPRHGPAPDRRLRVGRVPRRGAGDVVASPQRPGDRARSRSRSLLFAGWIGAITFALFRVGAHDSVTASRLESVAAPFASINDQLALVSWFQRAAPAEGFGIGAAPWCGFAPSRGCSGVPAQIHSDYTFTAIVGVFGPFVAWAASLAMRALAASPDPPPRPRHARRAAPGRRRRPARQRRPGAAQLDRGRLGRADARASSPSPSPATWRCCRSPASPFRSSASA